jgi:AcrR family transcriptional regulator
LNQSSAKRASAPDRSSAILEAARRSFMAYGYAGAKMEVVARDAGVSTATVYGCYGGKSELFRAVTRDSMQQLEGLFDVVERTRGDASVRLGVCALMYARTMAHPACRALGRMVIAEQRQFPELAANFQVDAHHVLGSRIRALLQDLSAAGLISCPDVGLAARQLQGLIEHSTLFLGLFQGDTAQPPQSLETIALEAVETFLARYGTPARP